MLGCYWAHSLPQAEGSTLCQGLCLCPPLSQPAHKPAQAPRLSPREEVPGRVVRSKWHHAPGVFLVSAQNTVIGDASLWGAVCPHSASAAHASCCHAALWYLLAPVQEEHPAGDIHRGWIASSATSQCSTPKNVLLPLPCPHPTDPARWQLRVWTVAAWVDPPSLHHLAAPRQTEVHQGTWPRLFPAPADPFWGVHNEMLHGPECG